MAEKILLKYSTEKADEPIIASIIRKMDVPINILHADLSPEGGEIFISIDASEEKINKVIELFEENGVGVEKIEKGIRLDEDTCLECGACLSLCPTDALQLDDDYSIVLNEEDCVYCGACVPACPVNSLTIRSI